MAIHAVVDSLDNVPEVLQSEYVKNDKDGKFYLDLDDSIRTHTAITPLQNALATIKTERENFRKKASELENRTAGLPEDFDPSKYSEIVEELERLRTDPSREERVKELETLRGQYEQRIQNLERRNNEDHQRTVTSLQEQVQKLNTVLDQRVAGDALMQAFDKIGVDPRFSPAVRALLLPKVRLEVDETTQEREAIVETDLGAVPVQQFVESWARSDEGKVYILPATGGGAPGSERRGSGMDKNPFTREHWNVTEQGKIAQTDIVKAQRLAAAAGTSVGGQMPAPKRAA